MLVKITSIDSRKGKPIVTFISPYGDGRAIWNGFMPVLNHQYDIEFDIKDNFVWNKNVDISPTKEFSIRMINSTLEIIGKIDSTDKSNCVLRVGESILLLSLEDIPVHNDDFLRIVCESVEIYDTNI